MSLPKTPQEWDAFVANKITAICSNRHCPHRVQFLTKNGKCRVCKRPLEIKSKAISTVHDPVTAWKLALGFKPDNEDPF